MKQNNLDFSIVIPAKNEAQNLEVLLPRIRQLYPEVSVTVIDDGSTDNTEQVCRLAGVNVVKHQYSKGNGASIKTGARQAKTEYVLFMDGDGQHRPEDIEQLLEKISRGFDMVVGARSKASQASTGRLIANTFYNFLSSWIAGHEIRDLTSGFRIVNRKKFLQFIYLLPNGFSYPTTCTMAFFRAGYSVVYVPIEMAGRKGESHINVYRDGIRFLIIIFKIGTLYSPLKIFLPIAVSFFAVGLLNYLFTFLVYGTFTNMSATLFTGSIIVFLIGLVSEQITALMYKNDD